jgi:hypothetical protein
VIRTGRIAGRRPDAAVLLTDQLLVASFSSGRVTPELAPYPLVQPLGEGLGQAVGQHLEHDARVVIVRGLEALQGASMPMPAVTAKAPSSQAWKNGVQSM